MDPGPTDPSAKPPAERSASGAARWFRNPRTVLALIAGFVLTVDLVAKSVTVATMEYGQRIEILGPLSLIYIRNPGAAFSMATGLTWLLTLIAIAVVVAIVRMGSRLTSLPWGIGLGLVLGGALGNLVDRLFRSPGVFRGHVVDFLSVGDWFAVFNTADSAITTGAVLLVVLTLTGRDPYVGFGRKDDARESDPAPGTTPGGSAAVPDNATEDPGAANA